MSALPPITDVERHIQSAFGCRFTSTRPSRASRRRVPQSLKNRMIQVQITLVASPRNHLYRTGQPLIEAGLFCIGPKAEFYHFCDFADDLDFEAIVRGSYRNVLD